VPKVTRLVGCACGAAGDNLLRDLHQGCGVYLVAIGVGFVGGYIVGNAFWGSTEDGVFTAALLGALSLVVVLAVAWRLFLPDRER
jgi:hypothetical protein